MKKIKTTKINGIKKSDLKNAKHLTQEVFNEIIKIVEFEIVDDFKLYMSDTGLLCSMIDDSIISLLLAQNENFIFKGALYENKISQMLVTSNFKLRYFEPTQALEIDFILSLQKGKPILLEVKSGNNRSKSLSTFLDKNNYHIGIKCTSENIYFKNKQILNIPWYLLFIINSNQEIIF